MIKRTLIAAAVTALSAGTAMAQSSVTVYGRLNTSAEMQKNIGAAETQYVMQNNASRLGFKGTEDLGGGLKADFVLEHRFDSDTGTTTGGEMWSGDSWLGLSGAFGSVRMGRLTSAAYFATGDWIGMHNHDTGTSSDALYDYLSGSGKNTFSYTTPIAGGVTLEGTVSADEGAVPANRVWNLAAIYDGGPLQLGAGYEQQTGTEDQQFAVRAAYTLGDFTFGGYYQRSDKDSMGTRNLFRVAGMYTMGASELHVNVGAAGEWSKVKDSDAMQYTVAYNYNLSKRTKVYAFYNMVDNGSAAGYGAAATGLDPSAFALGVRHNF